MGMHDQGRGVWCAALEGKQSHVSRFPDHFLPCHLGVTPKHSWLGAIHSPPPRGSHHTCAYLQAPRALSCNLCFPWWAPPAVCALLEVRGCEKQPCSPVGQPPWEPQTSPVVREWVGGRGQVGGGRVLCGGGGRRGSWTSTVPCPLLSSLLSAPRRAAASQQLQVSTAKVRVLLV